jgi:hypothetical protein
MFGIVDRTPPRPRWGALYALTAAMLALFGVVDTFVPPWAWRRTLELAVIILAFGTIHLWVRANRRALDLAGARDAGFRTVVISPDAERPRSEREVEVTITDSRDSKREASDSARRGGTRWTSSISA